MDGQKIREWVESNARGLLPQMLFADDEIDHIAMCMHHIYRWYHEGYPIGHFLNAVVKNDFMTACVKADVINQKALYLYALFCANKIPGDYREKAK